MDVLVELLEYLSKKRKYFLIPILIIIFALGLLLLMVEGTVFAPFIYTVF